MADKKAPHKKRGNGQGSAYKRGKTWTAVWTKCLDDNDMPLEKRIQRTKGGFATRVEALEYIPNLKTPVILEPKKKILTFKQLYDKWEPTHKMGRSTRNCYRAAFKFYLPLWDIGISQIDIDDLQECVDECDKGKQTRRNMKTICGLLYKYAIPRPPLVPHKLNLADYLDIVGGESLTKPGLTTEQLEIVRNHIDDIDCADLIYAHCYLGFRPTEFLTLDARNYNHEEKAFVGGSKTDAGKDRTVTVSPKVQFIVDRYMENKIGGPVFTTTDHKAISLKDYRASFYAALEKMGIENPIRENGMHMITPHSCRHTFATLMKKVDAPDKDKLELIGHTSAEMLRHYQDVDFNDLRQITDKI